MSERTQVTWQTPACEIETGAAYEFLMTLSVFEHECGREEEEAYEVDRGGNWSTQVREKAKPDLLEDLGLFYAHAENSHIWKNLQGMVYECEAPKDVPAFLAHLEAVDPLELRLHLIGYYQRGTRKHTPLDVILAAAEGDEEAQRQFLKTLRPEVQGFKGMVKFIFSLEAEAFKMLLLSILQRWYKRVFCDYEQEYMQIIERDAEAKRAMKEQMSFEQLFETATNGITYVPEPGLRKVLLIPCYVTRPWNVLNEYQGISLIGYPVADESVAQERNEPPPQLVRLYKALADERRLRILKLLTARSYSLQEIADEFGAAKTTMHHHMSILRSAGLVLARTDDNIYTLRRPTLAEASQLLDAYLKGRD
jgi:DNA-binding transcriptional ArsR family regulator